MACATGNPKEHIPVTFSTDLSALPQRVRDAAKYLAEAVAHIDALYLFQRSQNLEKQGGIFDDTKPLFVWPADLSRDELKEYLSHHPSEAETLLSPYSVVTRTVNGRLVSTPYHEVYKEFLAPAAALMDEAAYLLGEYPKFQYFLKERAKAFRDGSFQESDRAWVRAIDAPLELIIGPIESYEDKLRNIKCEAEGVLALVPNDAAAELTRFQESVAPFDTMLGILYGYHPKCVLTPMRVVDQIALGGDARYRYIAMACNLPNDTQVQHEVGSKKTFYRQVVAAKFKEIVIPIVERVLCDGRADNFNADTFLHRIVGHELAHGLSFRFEGEHFSDLAMSLEESKADVFGVLFLAFLEKRGIVRHGDASAGGVLHVADLLRQVRFGIEEAHAQGALMQWNWLEHENALLIENGKLRVVVSRLESAYQSLGDAFYKLATEKNELQARAFVKKWAYVPECLRLLTPLIADIPVDIEPHINVIW